MDLAGLRPEVEFAFGFVQLNSGCRMNPTDYHNPQDDPNAILLVSVPDVLRK